MDQLCAVIADLAIPRTKAKSYRCPQPLSELSTGFLKFSLFFRPSAGSQSSMNPKIAALLETITSESYEHSESEWQEALRVFHLNVSHIPAVQVILKQRRWRRQ